MCRIVPIQCDSKWKLSLIRVIYRNFVSPTSRQRSQPSEILPLNDSTPAALRVVNYRAGSGRSSEEFEYFEDEEGERSSSTDSDSRAEAESGIQPFQFEPTTSDDADAEGDDHGEEDAIANRRLDNTDWWALIILPNWIGGCTGRTMAYG